MKRFFKELLIGLVETTVLLGFIAEMIWILLIIGG